MLSKNVPLWSRTDLRSALVAQVWRGCEYLIPVGSFMFVYSLFSFSDQLQAKSVGVAFFHIVGKNVKTMDDKMPLFWKWGQVTSHEASIDRHTASPPTCFAQKPQQAITMWTGFKLQPACKWSSAEYKWVSFFFFPLQRMIFPTLFSDSPSSLLHRWAGSYATWSARWGPIKALCLWPLRSGHRARLAPPLRCWRTCAGNPWLCRWDLLYLL